MPNSGKIIAIVDDEPSVLRGLSRLLAAHDIRTEIFKSAETFLERGTIIDVVCIILDIHMGGISGIEMLRKLAARGSTVPVIFMTAHDSAVIRKEAIEAGCAAFLPKPFSGRELINAIRKVTSLS